MGTLRYCRSYLVKRGTDFSRPGGTGFGVRLLDNFVKENYEYGIKSSQIDFYYILKFFRHTLKLGEKLMGRNKNLVLVDKLKDLNDIDRLYGLKKIVFYLTN